METETGSEVRLESQIETRRRRALGALLSGALGLSVGFGMFGGWDWVGIIGLPVRPSPVRSILGAFLTGMPIAIPFLVWGLLVAWRREWREVALMLVLCCAAALGVVAVLVVVAHHDVLSVWIVLEAVVAFLVVSLLFRGGLGLVGLAFRRWGRVGYAAILVAVLLMLLLGRLPTLPLSLMGLTTDVAALRAVHQHARAQGWEGYTLALEQVGSATATVRVELPDGRTRTCDVTMWVLTEEEPTVECGP
jgi:hypothetical protein